MIVDIPRDPSDHDAVVGISGKFACGIAAMLAAKAAWAQQQPGDGPIDGVAKAVVVGKIGIGIGTLGPANLPTDLRIRLEDAAAAGLGASGARVVSAAELSRARAAAALGACADPVCERRLAQITDTRYWLRGTCQLDTSTYRLHLELVDAQSGAVVAGRDDTCDICTEADAADLANVAASSLKAALTRSQVSAVLPEPRTATSTRSAPTVAADRTPDENGAGTGANERPAWRRVLPWVAFAGAAAALAGGAYALTLNDGDCFRNCQTTWVDPAWRLGVPLLAIGAALATTGVILLRSPTGPAPTPGPPATATSASERAAGSPQLIISSGGVGIAGRF